MKSLTINQIQQVVCDFYRIPVDSTQTKSRKRELVQCRQITMYFARKKTKESLREIGLCVAGRDHATVLHAYKTVNNLIDTEKDFKYDIYLIERELLKFEGRISNELVAGSVEVADLHDFFPHPGSYPVIESTVNFLRSKLYTIKFRRFEPEVVNCFKPNPYKSQEKGYYRHEFRGYKVNVI